MRNLRHLLTEPFSPEDCTRALNGLTTEVRDELLMSSRLPAITMPLTELRRDRPGLIREVHAAIAELEALDNPDLDTIRAMIEQLRGVAAKRKQTDFVLLTNLRTALLTNNGGIRVQGLVQKGRPKSPLLQALQ